jgi:hypothetical protein
MAPPELLASDAERADTVEQLSLHCSRGRLTVEEFESRVAEAYAARTVGQLDALLSDLPAERDRDPSGAPAKAESVGVGLPGLRPFTLRTQLDVHRADAARRRSRPGRGGGARDDRPAAEKVRVKGVFRGSCPAQWPIQGLKAGQRVRPSPILNAVVRRTRDGLRHRTAPRAVRTAFAELRW